MVRRLLPALKLVGIGWYFATCIVLGVGGGYWLDTLSGLRPLFTLVGLLLALLVAFYGGYRLLADLLVPTARRREKR